MKLNPNFILQPLEDGVSILVPVGKAANDFHGIVRLNDTAAFIVRRMMEETDEAALVDALDAEYDGTREQFIQSVRHALETLREAGAVLE